MICRIEYQIPKLCGSRLWELGAYCDKLVKQEFHSSMIYVNRFIALCYTCQWPETHQLMCNFWAMSIKTLGSSQMVILWLASSQVSRSLFLNLSQLSGILFCCLPTKFIILVIHQLCSQVLLGIVQTVLCQALAVVWKAVELSLWAPQGSTLAFSSYTKDKNRQIEHLGKVYINRVKLGSTLLRETQERKWNSLM